MSESKMREEFEAWFLINYSWFVSRKQDGYSLERCAEAPFQYIETIPHHDFRVWQASRAALPAWQPMKTCPRHVDVMFYREDAGVFSGKFTDADSFMTDKERDEWPSTEEEMFALDAFSYEPEGAYRCDGDLVPTHWMPYPQEPEVSQ